MITCWLSRNIILSRVDTNTALPVWVGNHVRGCRNCQVVYDTATALAKQLSSPGNTPKGRVPPFLHSKIVSAVRAEATREVPSNRWRYAWATAIGTACLLIAGIVLLRQPPVPTGIATNSIAAPTEVAINVNLPTAAQVDQWAKTLDAPLEQETKLVLLDATAVINTLAKGFLPEDLLASSTEPARH